MRASLYLLTCAVIGSASVVADGCTEFGSSPASNSAPDASTDTTASDGGAGGGGDAGVPDSGAPTTYCDGVDAAFCADFDRDVDASGLFARWVARGGATMERTLTDRSSAPGSLWIRLPGADGGYEASGFASAVIDVSGTQHRTIEVDLALRADEPTTGKVQFLTVSLNGSGNGGISLSRKDGQWGLNMSTKGASGSFYPLQAAPGLGPISLQFRRIRLEAHFANDDTGYAKLSADDTVVVDSPLQQTTTELSTNAIEVQLQAASATGPTPPVQAKYDNVVIRTRP